MLYQVYFRNRIMIIDLKNLNENKNSKNAILMTNLIMAFI